ncbi:hypothetical protein Tco_1003748 [Tanacetum coccineum]|uniref:Uncharacterized protein n=1 Tax=Tanacetum coccineum TaxID=301880 RepID=A0ABQ5FAA3_9ASTR
MSQPANDEFSQHLSDDEESNHEDASDTGAAPKQQQQVIPQTTAISNIKLPILKKEEYDIWAMRWSIILSTLNHMRKIHGKDDAKRSGSRSRTRTNPEIDTLSIDDLYNNLRVFEQEIQAKGTHDGKKKRDSLYQHQEAGKQEKNQMGLLTMDDGIVNWGEHTEAEETNHALMAISSKP